MMTVDEDDAISALLRLDFGFFLRFAFRELGGDSPYQHNWHIDAIIEQLRRLRDDEIDRLIVTMPPRYLKSRIVAVAWVAWRLGHNPALSFLCISYGQSLAEDHADDCRKLMTSYWYRRAFPSLVLTRKTIDDLRTSAGGGRMANSIEGGVTGFGADEIIVDDPMKAQDAMSKGARERVKEVFDGTLMQRFNDPQKPRMVVVMQRLHEADLVGSLRKREEWHELCLPAIATHDEPVPIGNGRYYQRREGHALHPVRQSVRALLERKAANPLVFASQFQQDPIPAVGNMIEAAWLRNFDPSGIDMRHGQIVMSLDTASKDNPFNDYSVLLVALVQAGKVYVVDVVRERFRFTALKSRTIELARTHGATAMLIEDASSGHALIDSLLSDRPLGVPTPIARKPEGDKISRVMNVSAMIEAGRLQLPDRAPWLAEFKSELLGFPSARHDDQVDALSQLLIWVQARDRWQSTPNEGPIEITPEAGFEPSRDVLGSTTKDPWGAY